MSAFNAMRQDPVKPGADSREHRKLVSVGGPACSARPIAHRLGTVHWDPMKTAERILVVATELFNERGERNVTASDIALELDISPGNLYYHYKGKDDILSLLFCQCYRELAGMLATPILEDAFLEDSNPLERSWLFLTVLMEVMYQYRFLYLNQSDLMQRYPEIDRGMTRLLSLKRQTTKQLATTLLASVDISAHPQRLDHVADSMAMTLMYWLSFEHLTRVTPNAPADHPSRCAAGAFALCAISGRAAD
jgi:AcrR family transcriptional regulator